jgi:hypothetical protein
VLKRIILTLIVSLSSSTAIALDEVTPTEHSFNVEEAPVTFNLYNFILGIKESVHINKLTADKGKSYIVQDPMIFTLYDEYISKSHPVHLAIMKTNKATLRIIQKSKKNPPKQQTTEKN